jgi:ParB family chromosome partitioning protein
LRTPPKRQQQKAKRAEFLKQYWGVRTGRPEKLHQIGEIKTAHDIAEAVGVDEAHLNRILKLNELIPELQELVSSGGLGQTADRQQRRTPDL